MADETGSPDTLELSLHADSFDYKPGEIVHTRGADYRVEQLVYNSVDHTTKMFLLRADLIVKPIVRFGEDKISVQVTNERPTRPLGMPKKGPPNSPSGQARGI